MCGIGGFINNTLLQTQLHDLLSMQTSMDHRGPDGSAVAWWARDGREIRDPSSGEAPMFGLAHTRLSQIGTISGGLTCNLNRLICMM